MIFLYLFYTFFMIGIFGFGGGYGMLSLIQGEVVHHWHWMTTGEFTDIVAISQMTPGPVGINSATYCGYTAVINAGYSMPMGILGSFTATFALVLPSFILMILIAILGAAALMLMTRDNFSSYAENPWQFCISIFLFAATFVGTMWMKINPIRMICYSAIAGLVLLY